MSFVGKSMHCTNPLGNHHHLLNSHHHPLHLTAHAQAPFPYREERGDMNEDEEDAKSCKPFQPQDAFSM